MLKNKKSMFLCVWVVVAVLASCTNNEASTESKVDSTINKLDSAANAVYDSTKAKAKDIKENLDSAFDKRDFK